MKQLFTKAFNSLAVKIVGMIALILLSMSLFMPEVLADGAGNFWHLFTASSLEGKNTAKSAYLIKMLNSGKVTKFSVDSAGNVVATGSITAAGTSTVQSMIMGPLNVTTLYPWKITNYGSTAMATVDTTGKGVFRSIIIGTTQTATLYPSKTVNYGGTLMFAADTTGMVHGTAYLASLDSFTTTGTSKVITWAGAVVGDPVIVTPLVPAYSATPDTGCTQYAGYVTAGGGSVTVFRYLKAASSTYKSGAQFNVMLIARH